MHNRVLRLPEVEDRTGLKRSAIYRHVRAGTFPQPFKITDKATGWIEADIDSWIEGRVQESRGEVA